MRFSPADVMMPRMPSLYWASGRPSPQNRAVPVCSGLRTLLAAEP
jgi:hypothetical protein